MHAVKICSCSVVILTCSLFGISGSSVKAANTDYVAVGESCLKLRDYQKAADYFRSEIAYHSRNAAAHFGLAKAYFLMQRQDDAVKELELASTLDPNGAIGNQARNALMRRDAVINRRAISTTTSSAPARPANSSLAKTPEDSLSAGTLSHDPRTNNTSSTVPIRVSHISGGSISVPISAHMTEGHKEWLAKIETKYRDIFQKCRNDYDTPIRAYTAKRDDDSEGAPEREFSQQRITELKKSFLVDMSDCERAYIGECREVYDDAENTYAKSATSHAAQQAKKPPDKITASDIPNSRIQASAKMLASEKANREKTLIAERDQKIDALSQECEAKVVGMRLERDKRVLAAPTKEEGERIRDEWNELIPGVNDRYKIRIFELKKYYEQRLTQLSAESENLDSTQKRLRDDDAKLVPVGKSNLYSRSYQTYGEPTGNTVPLMAEPQALRLLPTDQTSEKALESRKAKP